MPITLASKEIATKPRPKPETLWVKIARKVIAEMSIEGNWVIGH
jgi:hypothetical protein